jgi:hypothetical protein
MAPALEVEAGGVLAHKQIIRPGCVIHFKAWARDVRRASEAEFHLVS